MARQTTVHDAIRVALCGAHGRMGGRIRRDIEEKRQFDVVRIVDERAEPSDELSTNTDVDIVIDFSSDSGAQSAAKVAMAHHAALLVGTTGLSESTHRRLREAASSVPVLVAPNVSTGVALLHRLARTAARSLGDGFDVDLVERHHRTKRDAPSGTALSLARALREAGVELPEARIHAIRAGDIVGEHTIEFTGAHERLTITHTAASRDLFAHGALRLAAWLVEQPAGMYTVDQALGT